MQKAVAEYAGVNLFDVWEMDVFTYWTLLHDAVVYNHADTEEGRKWLHNAWRITQTQPDESRLREKYGQKGGQTKWH